MIVLAEDFEERSPSSQDLGHTVAAARLAGCQVYTMPTDFSRCQDAEGALWHVPTGQGTAVWLGFIPDLQRYGAIEAALAARGWTLINSAEEHSRAMELDLACQRLAELTPATLAATTVAEAQAAALELGYPVFLKGSVQSRKARGWKACVAADEAQLTALVSDLLRAESRSRGRAMVRRLIALRYARTTGLGFPQGREYRYVVCHGQIVAGSYYWDADDPLAPLSPAEEAEVRELAEEAARRLEVPFCSVDLGQTEDGRWWVIETGDAQFCGLCQIPRLAYWQRLRERLG